MHWLGEQCHIVGQIMDSMSKSFHVFYRTMVHTNINNVRLIPLHIHFRWKHTKYNNLTTTKLR
jgi:hypothetical protein